jgi:hypothetical protein
MQCNELEAFFTGAHEDDASTSVARVRACMHAALCDIRDGRTSYTTFDSRRNDADSSRGSRNILRAG